jgi:hypothetical protein
MNQFTPTINFEYEKEARVIAAHAIVKYPDLQKETVLKKVLVPLISIYINGSEEERQRLLSGTFPKITTLSKTEFEYQWELSDGSS